MNLIKTIGVPNTPNEKTGGLNITQKNPIIHSEESTVEETSERVLRMIGRDHAAKAAGVTAGKLLILTTRQRRRMLHIKTIQTNRPMGMGRVTNPNRE